ncbi:hypothetical protein AB7M43_002832 [Bradyrhizobium elkanii]
MTIASSRACSLTHHDELRVTAWRYVAEASFLSGSARSNVRFAHVGIDCGVLACLCGFAVSGTTNLSTLVGLIEKYLDGRMLSEGGLVNHVYENDAGAFALRIDSPRLTTASATPTRGALCTHKYHLIGHNGRQILPWSRGFRFWRRMGRTTLRRLLLGV